MSLLDRLMAKPWEHAGEMDGMHGGNTVGRPPGKTGLYILLAVITSFFLLFSVSHQMRATYPDWKAVAEPSILWGNTVALILASVFLQWSANAARKNRLTVMRNTLLLAAGLSLAFMAGQWLAWREMLAAGFYAQGNPAYAFFYLFTAVHALHLLGGLWFVGRAVRTTLSSPEDEALHARISLCATYWHFLLGVWALLFYLLLSS